MREGENDGGGVEWGGVLEEKEKKELLSGVIL